MTRLFTSYSRQDQAFARRLVETLRARGVDVWFDQDDIPAGANWSDAIQAALQACDEMLLILSPDALASSNVNEEWQYFHTRGKRIVPVRLRPWPADAMHFQLERVQYVDFHDRAFDVAFTDLLARLSMESREIRSLAKAAPAKPAAPLTNRQKLIDNVRRAWIEGVLEKARIGDVWLDLASERIPDVVEPQIKRDLKRADAEPVTLASGDQIADVFRREGRALLILGAPGSGKTMTLLELASDLLDHAGADANLPVPVVLNLASWAEKKSERLEEWLIERVRLDYGVSRKLAERWLEDGDLLFLLDGLDEIRADADRAACVAAINRFWGPLRDMADNGIVVCSRVDEYAALSAQLQLASAIMLRPLTLDQAAGYLGQLGADWDDLRGALASDPVLQTFAASPLLVNIMAVAYQGAPVEQITGFARVDDQQRHLFDHYVARRLREDKAHPTYSNAKTRHYLTWLAGKMVEHEEIVFHIEGLQPTWLDTVQQRRYQWRVVLDVGLVSGVILGVFGGLAFGAFGGLFFGLFGGLFFGLFSMLAFGWVFGLGDKQITIIDRIGWSWGAGRDVFFTTFIDSWQIYLMMVVVIVLSAGMVVGLTGDLIFGLGNGLVIGLMGVLVFGVLAVLVSGLVFGLDSQRVDQHTQPNQGIYNSRRSGIYVGLVCGLAFGAVFGVFGGLVFGPLGGLASGLIFGAFCGWVFGLRYGFAAILRHITLRRILTHAGAAPHNYAEFLEYTSARHLTRQVGGGFVFRHRMLMEHFADYADNHDPAVGVGAAKAP